MKANTEYGLEGAFKVDTFDGKGNLVNTTDYFSNFITASGLAYPLTKHFAECFRFLSLGNQNNANSMDTTGLKGSPVSIKVVGIYDNVSQPNQSMAYLGPLSYSKTNCGVHMHKDGPAYYRGWKIPSGDNMVVSEDVTFKEFVVSPSSGSDISGKFAFSRVPREVTLRSGASAIISYRLKLKTQSTGINYLTGFNITQADTEDGELVTLWSTGTTGYYRQAYHGLAAIDINGNTFIPKFGDAMEPACRNIDKLSAYFSPDNSQFDCSATGGSANLNNPYKVDGLLNVAFGHDYSQVVISETPETYNFDNRVPSSHPTSDIKNFVKNIRYKEVKNPNYFDYTGDGIEKDYSSTFADTDVSVASPGRLGYNEELLDYRNKVTLSAVVIPLKFNPNSGQQERKKTITRRAIFTPVKSLGHNTRHGSFVYAYKNGEDYWPVVDCLFSNNSGQLLMDHYRAIKNIHIINGGSGISNDYTSRMVLNPPSFGKFNYQFSVADGRIYDFVRNELWHTGNYDLSLAAHKLSDLNSPSSTGKLYYPTSATEENLVSIQYNNLSFYRGGLGKISTGVYDFTPTKQLIADFKFSGYGNPSFYKAGFGEIVSGVYDFTPTRQLIADFKFSGLNGLTNHLTGVNVLPVANSQISGGFYITNTGFSGSEGNLNELELLKGLTGYTLDYFSGYLYSGNSLFSGFKVVITPEPSFSIDTGNGYDFLITPKRITRFFDTGDFLSSLGQRGSGVSLPNSDFSVRFSGRDTQGSGLYITYLKDSNQGQCLGHWAGTSNITGLLEYTDFSSPNSSTYNEYLTGDNHLAVADSAIQNGFYITNRKFTDCACGGEINGGALMNALTGYSLEYFSGYLYSGNSNINNFEVIVTPENYFVMDTGGGSDFFITSNRITRFFDTGDFLSSLVQRGSGVSLPNSDFNVRFSGKDCLGNDLYITYLKPSRPLDAGYWEGTSDITGLVRYTDFSLPNITYVHQETNMLKPNNYLLAFNGISYTGFGGLTGIVSSQVHGGTYPGLSDKNTLEVDVNISWSAPCAGVPGCSDPT